jgi:O-acetyl-ADP-ribose deacetylase (regulator of RNase III)
LLFAYGDLSSEGLLISPEFKDKIRAVVSAEDTCLSVGGGVALSLAQKAGVRQVLYDLGKFGPVDLGSSVVSSAGRLPVHYILHAAAVEVRDDGPFTSADLVKRAMTSVTRQADALNIQVLIVPLLGAGVATLNEEASLAALLPPASEWLMSGVGRTVVVAAYSDAHLAMEQVDQALKSAFGEGGQVTRVS